VMTTTDEGYYYGATLKLEYPAQRGFYGMLAYTYSEAKDLMSAGSIASGSYTGARSVNGNNSLDLSFSDQSDPHRVVGLFGYRIEYGSEFLGATQISLGYVGERRGFNGSINSARYSYSYGSDMNGDGIPNNDLLYVPNSASELMFDPIVVKSGPDTVALFTPAQQQTAFDAFIDQDEYLSTRRGQYAERNGVLFPFISRFDLSLMQEVGVMVGGKRNALQFRIDILNFSNLLNDEWGLGNVQVTDRPLSFSKVTAEGVPVYRLATRGSGANTTLINESFIKGVSQFDVWSAQFGIRYIFN
jgi:hypothetical protein